MASGKERLKSLISENDRQEAEKIISERHGIYEYDYDKEGFVKTDRQYSTARKQGTFVPSSGLQKASRKGTVNTYTNFKSFSERKKEEEEKKKKTDRFSGLQKASTAGTEKLYTDFSKTSKEKPKNDIWEGLKRATIAGDPTPTAEEKERAENFFKGVGTSIAATGPTMWNLISQTRKDWKEKVEREGLQSALSEMARNMDNPDYTFGEPLSKDSKGYKLYQKANEYFAKSQEGLSPTEQYMSQLAASGAQVLSTLPLSALTGSPYPTLALMGANAAASKANELTDQGKTATEILGRSVLSGAIETATEKIPLDELFSIARFGGKGILKSALKQFGVEGSEELLSYIMNYAADVANNDETADFSLKEAFLNFVGGGLVGAALGAGASYIGSFNQATPFNVNIVPGVIGGLIGNTDSGVSYNDIGKRINEIGALDGVVNIGLENDIGTTSRSMSEDINARIENGEIITDEEVGRLYEETVKDFEAKKADPVQPIDEPVNISTESTNDLVDNTDAINIPQENSVISDVVDTPIQNYEPEISNLPAISEEYKFNIDDILQQTANEMIAANRADAINKIENSQNEIGENGAKALRTYYNDSYNFDDYYNGFIRYYEAGKVGLPIEQVNTLYGNNIAPEVKYAAYMTGINDAQAEVSVKAPVETSIETPDISIETSTETPDIITNISETAAPVITPVTTPVTTKSSPKKKYKTIKTKKSDWNSHDVEWHTPNQKAPIAYSTVAASDLIEVLSDDNPTATIKEIKNLINYDPEAKRVLQQYIEAGYGDDIASEFFSRDNKVSAKESAENGKSKLAEVSDEGRIQQSDISGQSRGRLLDKVPSENVQPDEGRRNIVSDVERGRGELSGLADRNDTSGIGTGRSVGSNQRADIQPSSGEVSSAETLYREIGPKRLESYLYKDPLNLDAPYGGISKIYVSKSRELAIGQGDNKGIMLEFDSKDVPLIKVNKPLNPDDGEFIVDDGSRSLNLMQDYLRNNLKRITINKSLIGEVTAEEVNNNKQRAIEKAALNNRAIRMLRAKGWFESVNSDGDLVFENPKYFDKQTETAAPKETKAPKKKPAKKKSKEVEPAETADTTTQETTVEEQTKQEVEQKSELATQELPKGNNFVIPETGLNLPRGEKARFKANVDAIKTLKNIMAEGRYATPEEQIILSKYVGWGGLANAFDESKTEWAKEYKQLKNLLSEEEYKSARASTLNAHYTETGIIKAIYKGLEGIGFKGGRILEPSAGIGHFIGAMPENLIPGVRSWTAVELDDITGNIAKYLYPNADVRVQGFEKAKIPNDYMDMAISNVPFGNYAIADKTYPKAVTGAIHNYFFAKSLDKVRPGGIVCFITSRYTMDSYDKSVRQYIADRADLLGAIRLPDTAFKSNAGTEVVTDILILKKREPNTLYKGEAFENTDNYHYNLNIYEQTNEYFKNHPEMVLGTPEATGSMYRGNSLTYKAKGNNLPAQIEKAFSKIKGKMDYPVKRTQEDIRQEIKQAEAKGKNGSLIYKNGKLYRNNEGILEEASDINESYNEKLKGIIQIRDAARKLLDLQLDNASTDEISAARKQLNAEYDAFVKKNGVLNSTANKKIVQFDVDSPFILSLENYDKDSKKASKADIFNKNTVQPNITITSVNTIEEGLTVSMNETGTIDINRIAELVGEKAENVKDVLLKNKLAFKNRNGELEPAEIYLSGNVKAKLKDAEALAEGDPDYKRNVEELKKIIPADIPAEDISVRPGATWIPTSIYSDFVAEMLGSSNSEYNKSAIVTYSPLLNKYTVDVVNKWLKNRPESISTWGTPDRSFDNIFEATLNNRSITVWRKLDDGSRILDKQATTAAQEKQEKIIAEFKKWLWEDDNRKTALTKLYNDVFNNMVTPTYDGSNLTVNGMSATKQLRSHQKNAIQRIINSGGNTLLAHKVGAGKTYEMAAAAMKLRQLGIIKKPMFVVPKSLVAQWGNEFLELFPAAKVLVLGEKDFSASNRKIFANRIATGDYDAVILSQEQFKAVPMSVETQEQFYQEQIDALELALQEAARNKGSRLSVKQLERSKKSLETKLQKLADMKKDENNIDFEQLGVDALFIDEAHYYKNLFYSTNMNNVSGLGNKDGSQKAFDLYMKVRYLQKLNGGRGVVFATATPVMNSMSEMYIMQKYLQNDLLEAKGLTSFDAWANQFGEVVTVLEMNPSGKGFRQKQSFSRFKNLAELQQMFRGFADVVTEIQGLKIPAMKENRRIIMESEPSKFQMNYIDKLAERADDVKSRKVDPKEDNMLKITSDGRKLSYTQRMIDPSLEYEADNKITKCADNVYKIWKETKDIKGTQLIFCDLSTPKGGSSNTETSQDANTAESAEDISIYDDIKNMLVGAGIPSNEIAFIHSANTNEKKAKLFKDVNDGKVRVLIGSTGKMGVGMNAQKRIVALHHLDAPWRPGDIEQREGRALRQGNINEEVGIYVYVTKKTFDSRMWDNLQRKASFIHQIMAGDLTARESEGDGDFALSAAEIKAISSGNPLIIEQFEVAAEISKLETLERAHNKEVFDAKKRIRQSMSEIASDEDLLSRLKEDLSTRQDTTGDKFNITIEKKSVTDRKKAGEMLIKEAKAYIKLGPEAETIKNIGKFAGFELYVTSKGDAIIKGKSQYRSKINMDSPVGTIQSLEAAVKRIDKIVDDVGMRLSENKKSIDKLRKTAESTFARADELIELRKRNAEIMAELNPPEQNNADMIDDEDASIDYKSRSYVDEDVDYSVDTSEKPKQSNYADQWTAQRVGDTETAPKTLSEIVAKLQHDFGVNITTGHIRGNGVRGLYNKSNKGIKTKIANDIPTISHELGHFIDKKYNIINDDLSKELEKELVDNLGDEMKEAYDKKKWKTEGFAEFMRKFMQNREVTAIDYPKFTKHFLNSLDGKDQAILLQFADDINAYYALDADTATSSVRLREEKAFDARTTSEKIKDKASVFYQAWVDSNYGIKRFDKATGSNAYTLATNSAYSDSVAGQVIIGDLTDINGKYVAPGLRTVLQGINLQDKNEYRLFGEYLLVKHGPERLAEGMRVFADDRKNSTAFMEKRKAELEEQYPAFKQASERLYSFINDFYETWAVKTGLISQDTLNKWNDRWEYYVPLNRAVGDKGLAGAKKGFANQNSTIKRAKGSGLDVVHPVDNLINNIVNVVNAGTRNNVMVHITDSAEQLHADARFIEKVSAPLKIQKADLRGVKLNISNKIEELGLKSSDQEAVDEIVSGINDILIQYGRGKAYSDVVTVLKNGEPEYWKINDPLLLSSLTNMAQSKMDGILDAYAIISRFMTSNITGNNAVWSIFSNAPRDTMALFTYSISKNPIEVFGAIGKAYINKTRMSLGKEVDPLYREYLAMGGGSTSAYTADRDLAKRARKSFTGKKFSANPLDWIAFVSDTVEMGPRFATYKMLRDRGVNPQEAFFGAMDITVNFRRGGRYARQLNKAVPFFNAGVQGLDKFARWISADDIKGSGRKKAAAYRTFGFIAASAILAAIVYALNNSDEEKEKEYEQLSNYIKNGFWNIPLGDGKYFAIPKPRELGVLSSFIERTMERTIGENEYAFKDFYGYVAENYLPKILSDVAQVGDKGLEETGMSILGNFGLFGIVAYLGANRDFLGRPIVSGSLERLEPKQQYTNRTSKIAYWIGQAFNMSPVKIDYFFNQVLGGWWKYQKALFPIDEQYRDFSLGVGNTYIKDNQYSNDLTDWLYDKAEESTTAKNSYPNNIDKAITAKMDNSMKDFYSRYYQLAKDKPETDQSRITRQKVLDMIYDYRAASDSDYFGKYVEQVKEFCKKVGDESYLPSVMPTEIKDGRDKKHQLTDTQYVEYQELYNTEYWNLVEDTFKKSASEKKNTVILKKIGIVAQEEATNKMLKKMGLPKTGYAEKYKGIDSDDVVDFMTAAYLANEDGGLTQKESADIILDMDLNDEDSYTLFFSQHDDSKRAFEAYDAGIDADDYLYFISATDGVRADKDENGKSINGSKKEKIMDILDDMNLSDYEYWTLMELAGYKNPYDD